MKINISFLDPSVLTIKTAPRIDSRIKFLNTDDHADLKIKISF